MSKILKDPLAVKKKEDGRWPWAFNAPSYDNRTSSSIPCGNDYGVGHLNPVGKETAGSMESGPIPQKAHCFSPKEIFDSEDKKG